MDENNQALSKHSKNSGAVVPSAKERQELISSLEQRLTPASRDEIERLLEPLFSQFPTATSGDISLRIDGYVLALSGFSAETLAWAVRAVLKGETECSPDFMPSAPRLAQVCRRLQGYRERELKRARNDDAFARVGYYLESWMESGEGAQLAGDVALAIADRTREKAA